jgi:hypothetical protein
MASAGAGLTVAQYARHRRQLGLTGQTPQAVRKALLAGRIVTLSNGRLSPSAADEAWARNTDPLQQRGVGGKPALCVTPSLASAPAAVPSRGTSLDGLELNKSVAEAVYLRGKKALAKELVTAARREWPAFIANVSAACFDALPAEERLVARATEISLFAYLLENWLEDYLQGASLPEVDWSIFGADAERMKAECEDVRRYWRGDVE